MTSSYSTTGPLTPRQRDVLACAAAGLTVNETAAKLGISPATVRTVRPTAIERLGERRLIPAVLVAHDRGELT